MVFCASRINSFEPLATPYTVHLMPIKYTSYFVNTKADIVLLLRVINDFRFTAKAIRTVFSLYKKYIRSKSDLRNTAKSAVASFS